MPDKKPATLQKTHNRTSGKRFKQISKWLQDNRPKYPSRSDLCERAARKFSVDPHYVKCIASKAIPSEMKNVLHMYSNIPPNEAGLIQLFSRDAEVDSRVIKWIKRIESGKGWMFDCHLRDQVATSTVLWKRARERWKKYHFLIPSHRGLKLAWAGTPEKAIRFGKLMKRIGG